MSWWNGKPRPGDPRAEGLTASEIDWTPSLWFRLFGETKIFRLFASN